MSRTSGNEREDRETLLRKSLRWSGWILNNWYCRTRALSSSRASERHEIALEPHWFRVQTERIKRCNSQAKKDYSKD
ncbi:BQ5605_C019g08888 [Microbotryum silenes-dioicae]|uniref:BQ5605_C019g08888 protein n=1 Tax=Microbotryum silenes-dioicae TaxID=796604 RepID=A0A2X0NTM3_9BASI|nr:BQ5605_C019g08888 [Microbotryum silenes-dioicae]